MSIIYEALQKVQQQRDNKLDLSTLKKNDSRIKRNKNFSRVQQIEAGSLVIVFCLIATVFFEYHPQVKMKTPAVRIVQVRPIKKGVDEAEYLNKHILNGIFFSEQEKIAQINNRMFHVGDVVDGMKIIEIEPERVLLENANQHIVLRMLV